MYINHSGTMMMSKPGPEKSVEEDTLPAFATLPETKKKTPLNWLWKTSNNN
jgi:hypothetical protein